MRHSNGDLWKVAIVLTVGTIILLIFMALILRPEAQTVYIRWGNIFDKSFTEPFESLYLVFYNGDWISFSTHHLNTVLMTPHNLVGLIEERGKKLEDVAIIVHNHFVGTHPSQKNSIFLKRLRGLGYKGSFCIYATGSGKVACNPPIDN